MKSSRLTKLIGAAAALAFLAASPAQGATRYASPSGTGPASDCPRANPCAIGEAVSGATAGDTVVPLPGTYSLGATGLNPPTGVTIAGEAGQPRPRLVYEGTLVGLSLGVNTVARNIHLEATNAGSGRAVDAIGPGAVIEQSEVVGNGSTGITVQLRDWGSVRSSIIRSNATAAFAYAIVIGGVGGSIHNVTAIAAGTAPATAIGALAPYSLPPNPLQANVVNTIAIANGGPGIEASDDAGADNIRVNVDFSNFPDFREAAPEADVVLGPGNQTGGTWLAPSLASPITADFHQLPGSPTIEAGANGFGGALDIDGQRRSMETRNDIGADEFPGQCAGRTATVTGTVGPETLTGTPGPDVIIGLAGKDRIRGLGGDDVICGGGGPDKLLGGGGNDRLLGEAGADTLKGGPGKDRLLGGSGRDKLLGGKGKDRLNGGPGRDSQVQ